MFVKSVENFTFKLLVPNIPPIVDMETSWESKLNWSSISLRKPEGNCTIAKAPCSTGMSCVNFTLNVVYSCVVVSSEKTLGLSKDLGERACKNRTPSSDE